MTSCLTGFDKSVLQIKTKIVNCHTADSKPVKQEDNGTIILPLLVFPGVVIKMLSKGVKLRGNRGPEVRGDRETGWPDMTAGDRG